MILYHNSNDRILVKPECGCEFTIRPYFDTSFFMGNNIEYYSDSIKICSDHRRELMDILKRQEEHASETRLKEMERFVK